MPNSRSFFESCTFESNKLKKKNDNNNITEASLTIGEGSTAILIGCSYTQTSIIFQQNSEGMIKGQSVIGGVRIGVSVLAGAKALLLELNLQECTQHAIYLASDSHAVIQKCTIQNCRNKSQNPEKKELTFNNAILIQGSYNFAFVVKKGALDLDGKAEYKNTNTMLREKIIEHIVNAAGNDLIVSTTGKASRELFEIREAKHHGHEHDFLTVGSMGHSSSIALGIALKRPERKVWCIDGDGAVLMHMGAMAVIGANKPDNMIHVVINNNAHESVGGMPTVAGVIDLIKIAEGCGYPSCKTVSSYDELDAALKEAKKAEKLTFIEAKAAIGARADLGRPTTSPAENMRAFMQNIRC